MTEFLSCLDVEWNNKISELENNYYVGKFPQITPEGRFIQEEGEASDEL